MKPRRIASVMCRTIAGISSFYISAYGALYVFAGVNLHQDTVPMSLFCILPMLSFPAFILSFWRFGESVTVHWVFAFGYLAVYSMLDWRTCSELGYCKSALATVLETLTAGPVRVTFAIAIMNLAALLLYRRRFPPPREAESMRADP